MDKRKIMLAGLVGIALVTTATKPSMNGAAQDSAASESSTPSRITFGGNLYVDPCFDCNYYSENSGLVVWGPNNCSSPGHVERLAMAFVASTTGVPDRIYASIVLNNADCPTNKVTLGIYTDACYPTGVGMLLVSGIATVPSEPCGLAMAKLRNAPTLQAGVKYWVAATTTASQAGLDALWYSSNAGQIGFDQNNTGWAQGTGNTLGFSVQGPLASKAATTNDVHRPFGDNMIVDPCTGCDYDRYASGVFVRGPNNCSSSESTNWAAVPFIVSHSGVPRRILVGMRLRDPASCPSDMVTLSLYSDNCGLGPGTALVSGTGVIRRGSCNVTEARLRGSPSLNQGQKYWVVATTTIAQGDLDAEWYGSVGSQFNVDLGDGWTQFNALTPAFRVD